MFIFIPDHFPLTRKTPSGANTLTFMIPAEIFPTAYRCFCHGISAASGKLGSIVILFILYFTHAGDPGTKVQGYIFIIFGVVMAIGAVFSWAWVPDIQNGRADARSLVLRNKRLEELGGGYQRAVANGNQTLGFRRKLQALFRRLLEERN